MDFFSDEADYMTDRELTDSLFDNEVREASNQTLSVKDLSHRPHLSVPIRKETRVHIWVFPQFLLLHWEI